MVQLVNGRLKVTGVREQVMELIKKHPEMTYEEIGRIVGCTRQRVGQIAGVGRKNPGRTRRDITVEKVTELYDRNLWIREMANALGCAETLITRRLRAAGIGKSNCYSRGRILYLERAENGNEGSGSPEVGCTLGSFVFIVTKDEPSEVRKPYGVSEPTLVRNPRGKSEPLFLRNP